MWVVPRGLPDHMGGPPGQGSYLLVPCTFSGSTSCHSYCKARNGHWDYFLTTTPPHTKATNSNYKYEFYSLMPPPLAGGFLHHWPPSFLPLGWQWLLLLPLTEKNINTITMGHTYVENYTIILQ